MNRKEFFKKSLIIILNIIILLIFSCSKNPFDCGVNTTSYFPLAIGNEWNYSAIEGTPYSDKIISRIEIDGKEYFEKVRYSEEIIISSYYREENGAIYILEDSVEYLYIDFNKEIGDKWQHPIYSTRYKHITSKTDNILTYAGEFNNCIQVVDEGNIGIIKEWYTSGIGIVKSSLEFKKGATFEGPYLLSNAFINGNKIP